MLYMQKCTGIGMETQRGCLWELRVQVTVMFFFVFSDTTQFFLDNNCNALLKSNAAISQEEEHCF